jgi:hypothetical protein
MHNHIKITGATLLTAAVAAGCLLAGAGSASAATLGQIQPVAVQAAAGEPTVLHPNAVYDAATNTTTVTGSTGPNSSAAIRWPGSTGSIALTHEDGSFTSSRPGKFTTVSVRAPHGGAWQSVTVVEKSDAADTVVAEPSNGQVDPGFVAPGVVQPSPGTVDPGFTVTPSVQDAAAVYDAATNTTTVTGSTGPNSSAAIRWPGSAGSIALTHEDGSFTSSRSGKFTTVSVRAPHGGAWQSVIVTTRG